MSTRVRHEGGSCSFGFSPLSSSCVRPRVDVPIQPGDYSCFFSFLFFFVSLPMTSQGRSLVFSAILIETHSSSAFRSKKYCYETSSVFVVS